VCANADDNSKAAFEDVADLLSTCLYSLFLVISSLFSGEFFSEMDLVPTDVWAGLLLLANREWAAMNARSTTIAEPLPTNRQAGLCCCYT
jgi:hypothetical protein